MSAAEIVYRRLTPLYDVVCGPILQPGRRQAIAHLHPQPGESILEVGVGTGRGLSHYPAACSVVAIDLSRPMMARAQRRHATHRSTRVNFAQMDATQLAFPDETFDAVYVPYTINVVPDPIAVGRELVRVCRVGGRILMLNHFDGIPETTNVTNTIAGRLASAFSVKWNLHVDAFLGELGLSPTITESVNVPRLSSIVMCRKGQK